MWLNPVGTAILDFNVRDSLKTGILHRFGFSQYKNYCQTSPTLGKIEEFYNFYEGIFNRDIAAIAFLIISQYNCR
jgi:hypothetical protein